MTAASASSALPSSTRTQRVKAEIRALWQLTWPILIGQLAVTGMSVTDVAMAGHASAQDLAGVALGVSVLNIVLITLMGLMMSVSPTVSQLVGAKALGEVPHVVRQGLWKALGVGLVALVLANLAALVFDHMALEPRVRDIAKSFVLITSFSLPAFAAYRVLYGYSTSLNQTKPMMVIALCALLLNAAINWVLVYGNLGFPQLGGVGCAWSTLACVWFNIGALVWWMHRSSAYRSTWPFGVWEAPHWPKLRELLALGAPIGVTYFAETSAFSLIALLVAGFGSNEIAAHQIALNFSSLVFMMPLSLGVALLTRVGQSLGAGDPVQARFRAWVGVNLALMFAACTALSMALFAGTIARAYTSDAAVIALTVPLLLFAALFQLSDTTQVMVSCAIRGYKVTRAPMVIHLTAFWGFSLPLGCVLGLAPAWLPEALRPAQAMGAAGFWLALVVGLTVAALGLVWLLRLVSWQHIEDARSAA